MILVARDIQARNLVEDARSDRWRPTTYDATVGPIIQTGTSVTEEYFTLPPRGIVWVVSNESFNLTDDITGIATLKTSWTHRGILALNVGVIDPGWHGPLSAAIVNFGNHDFQISRNEAFLIIAFFSHKPTHSPKNEKDKEEYINNTKDLSVRLANTFLDIQSLSREVKAEISASSHISLWFTRVAAWVALISAVVAVLSVLFPVAYSVYVDISSQRATIELLKKDIEKLKEEKVDKMEIY